MNLLVLSVFLKRDIYFYNLGMDVGSFYSYCAAGNYRVKWEIDTYNCDVGKRSAHKNKVKEGGITKLLSYFGRLEFVKKLKTVI